jgi:endonuclease I
MRKELLKYILLIPVHFSMTVILAAQPAGYYTSAEGLNGIQLQQALHDIIDNHIVQTYASLWTHFQSTDKNANGNVWDMYSDIPSGTPYYKYTFVTNQCGNYSAEGDCYNREHSFPKSWFGGEVEPMYTDLFHIYPTDGFVNGKRDNFPFGEVASSTWISTNGSKLGPSKVPGYSGTVFEPIDNYKGDFARTYFYMATRYYNEDSGWPGSDMVTGSQLKSWALQMLIKWDQDDPVSQKEKDRNDAVYQIQGNRNPFIDNAAFVNLIWDSQTGISDIH